MTLIEMTKWIISIVGVTVIGFVLWYIYKCAEFVISIQRSVNRRARLRALSRERLERYPKLKVTHDSGMNLLHFDLEGFGLDPVLNDDVSAWCRENRITVYLLRDEGNPNGPNGIVRLSRYFSFDTDEDAFLFKIRWL